MPFQPMDLSNRVRMITMKRLLNLFKADDGTPESAAPPPPSVVAPPQPPDPTILINQALEEKIAADSQERVREAEQPASEADPLSTADTTSAPIPSTDMIAVAVREITEPLTDAQTLPSRDESSSLLKADDFGRRGVEPEEKIAQPSSLLSNSRFIGLVEECAGLMMEFEGYTDRLETEEGKMIAQLVVQRLQEALERSGLARISDEESFSILRHTPVPMRPVAEGAPIAEILAFGLAIENRVFRKAKVKVRITTQK